MKVCKNSTCSSSGPQPLENFNKCKANKDGLQSYCKLCHRQKASLWNSNNKIRVVNNKKRWYSKNAEDSIKKSIQYHKRNTERDKENFKRRRSQDPMQLAKINKNSKLKTKFNITLEQYEAMFNSQNGYCAICSEIEKAVDKRTNKPRALAVDHCHKTGQIRQLLCNRCNHVLGLIKDDESMCDFIKDYLCRNKK